MLPLSPKWQAVKIFASMLCSSGFTIGLWTLHLVTQSWWMKNASILSRKPPWPLNLNGRFVWSASRFGNRNTKPSIFEPLATAKQRDLRAWADGQKRQRHCPIWLLWIWFQSLEKESNSKKNVSNNFRSGFRLTGRRVWDTHLVKECFLNWHGGKIKHYQSNAKVKISKNSELFSKKTGWSWVEWSDSHLSPIFLPFAVIPMWFPSFFLPHLGPPRSRWWSSPRASWPAKCWSWPGDNSPFIS